MILRQLKLGPMANFLYILGDTTTQKGMIVDPAWDAPILLKTLEEVGCELTGILLTHGHPDHVNAVSDILEQKEVPVYLSKHEPPFFLSPDVKTTLLADQEMVVLGTLSIKCLHTPGHSPGSQCFWIENTLISGDTVFINGCGRCDLPGGSPRDMYHSLYNRLSMLPDETMIYPGHHYGTKAHDIWGNQKKTNPYLRASSIEDFLLRR